MDIWVVLVLLYAVFRGIRDGVKKKALGLNSTFEVLFLYTLISFVLVIPQSENVADVPWKMHIFIQMKSLCVFSAWVCNFSAIKKLPVSFSGVMDTSGMIFSAVLSVIFLHETISLNQGLGFVLVIFGLILLNIKKNPSGSKEEAIRFRYVFLCLMGSLFNSTSGTMDKVIMQYVSSSQLQFYFLFYLVALYGIYILVTKTKISLKTLKSNLYIPLMSILLVVGDKALFEANADPSSKVVTMTLIKRSSVFVSIIVGRLMFKEKNILLRVICALIVLMGIAISVIK